MPEQELAEVTADRDEVYSYGDYVNALTDRLHITADTNHLYASSAMDLKPWLDAVELPKDATPVDAEIRVGPGSIKKQGTKIVEFHSDAPLPERVHNKWNSGNRLAAYGLAEAKLRFLDKHYEDLPALRGFKLQRELADIRSQVRFYEQNGYWNDQYEPMRRKFLKTAFAGAFILALASCGVSVGTDEIPTSVPPTQGSGEVTPGGNDVEQSFFKALDAWRQVEFRAGTDVFKIPAQENADYFKNADGSVFALERSDQQQPNNTFGKVTVANEAGAMQEIMFMFDLDENGNATTGYYLPWDEQASQGDHNSFVVLAVDAIGNVAPIGVLEMPKTIDQQSDRFATLRTGQGSVDLQKPGLSIDDLVALITFVSGDVKAAPLESSPTKTPSATPEPTKTPDPLAGAPEGATGKDSKGNYIKTVTTENGNTLEYTFDAERNSWYRPIFTGYTLDRSQETNIAGYPDALLMTMYIDGSIKDELSIPTLSHADNTDPANKVNFSARYFTNMINAVKGRGLIKTISEFNKPNFDSHKFYLDFVNADGPQRWGLWPGTTIDVHIRGDYDQLKTDMATNGFSETQKKTLYGPANNYMLKIWADTNNNLHVDIAPSIPATKWTEDMFYEMAFIGPGEVFESPDQTHQKSGRTTSEFIGNRKQWPYFTFGPPQ